MTTFNVRPALTAILLLWIPAVLFLPPELWAVLSLWGVFFWGPIVDAANWRIFRKEREAAEAAQIAALDAHERRIEAQHGIDARERAVALATKKYWLGLTEAEQTAFTFLCTTERTNAFGVPAARTHQKAAE